METGRQVVPMHAASLGQGLATGQTKMPAPLSKMLMRPSGAIGQ